MAKYFIVIIKMIYSVITFILFHLSCFVVVKATENLTSCQTPDHLSGECKVIQSCPSLLTLLQTRPLNSSTVDYLLKSRCKGADDHQIVCCPITKGLILQSLSGGRLIQNDSGKENKMQLLPSHEICGLDTGNKIYGGEKTGIREYPWLVSVQETKGNNNQSHFCGGVLINSRYVLTAAHCLKGVRFRNITTVRLGEHNLDTDLDCVESAQGTKECAEPAVVVAVEKKIVHEEFNQYATNRYNDIALLRLAKEIKYTGFIQPICLPKPSQIKDIIGKKLTVAGWGKTENSTAPRSSEKLQVDVPVKENTECSSAYRDRNVVLTYGQICAGGELNKDSCKGDSGGPLMTSYGDENGSVNWYSIGVVSYGPWPCGMVNNPGIYINVSNYLPWIISKLEN